MHSPTYYITFNLFRMELDDYDNLFKVIAVAEAFGELEKNYKYMKNYKINR